MKQGQENRDRIDADRRMLGYVFFANAVVMVLLSVYFFVVPFFMIGYFISDPTLKGGAPSQFALWLHWRLSPRYQKWAVERVASDKAERVHLQDISGTEWPMFCSVFYLLGTEYLEQGFDGGNSSVVPPSNYAAGAIEAATALVVDEGNAAWVKQHWGKDYRHRENVFYRMLLISGITSHQKLIGDGQYLGLLRDQVESFSAELDASPFGLLDDYPGQCFPTDVAAALAAIKRADEVLGTDHSEFLRRSLRGFEGQSLDPVTGMPPYMVDATTGFPGEARGCSGQWAVRWAAALWSQAAKDWYECFDKHFWQRRFGMAGFREFTKGSGQRNWYFDVDSGPVVGGFGAAASAFGLGAARANGRFDHAYPLAVEAIVLSWPLADGTLLLPRLLSNASDAPYIGETAVLFNISQPVEQGFEVTEAGSMPGIVYWFLPLYLVIPVVLISSSVRKLSRWWKNRDRARVPYAGLQALLWIALMAVGNVFLFYDRIFHGLVFVLLCLLLPRGMRFKKAHDILEAR